MIVMILVVVVMVMMWRYYEDEDTGGRGSSGDVSISGGIGGIDISGTNDSGADDVAKMAFAARKKRQFILHKDWGRKWKSLTKPTLEGFAWAMGLTGIRKNKAGIWGAPSEISQLVVQTA